MNTVLIVFESKYGQAEKIAGFARHVVSRRGLPATVLHVDAAERVDVGKYPAIVVVAPVYFGRHARSIERFLRSHARDLSNRHTAFVSVSNSAANADASQRAKAVRAAHSFVAAVGVAAEVVLTAGGAIAYPRYGILLRLLMKSIARRTGQPRDTSRVHELTDWPALEGALSRFLASAAPELTTLADADTSPSHVRARADESGLHRLAPVLERARRT